MNKFLVLIFFLFSLVSFAQTNIVDVIIDNKPAKLNIKTGDYKFVDGSVVNSSNTLQSLKGTNIHVVKSGETLYSLSKKYEISIAQIKSVNNLDSNTLYVGQKLAIGYSTSRIIANKDSHTVSKGETLYRIAKNNNLSVLELKRLNGLNTNIISIGQVLKLN
ncbi:LysM peptidoglycan-binding domain-containing protein [Lacinutrix sp. MedPE-SW]|uniref:LysM peptidoglycan-binding domain-containing protein n=1 Tax=Lacinutrix sp. MedPE-SW TaxID=1860087 RepID=UPI00091D891D|nr:LysM peptidoglycan-binding domain-containing protein [Lacinutrix sp. MedPE-SW]OIQ22396.1 MAG: hypothetical protein BM549_07840 [Lacinutrix sp. MedPE-SW]